MVSKAEKKEMMDYVVENLEGYAAKVIPRSRELLPGINSNYVLVGENNLVFLVDQKYANNCLSVISRKAERFGKNPVFLFFKDGKTFFRSASKDKRFKKDHDLSLKCYSNKELNRMIMFQPEEEHDSKSGWLQYYQPQSARLPQGIVSFRFEPVVFDYTHIPIEDRITEDQEESKKLRIWTERDFNNGKLELSDGFLAPR